MSGLSFSQHGAHKACIGASQHNPFEVWRQAKADHAKGGNPHLPAGIKTGLGFAGGLLLLILGLVAPKQRWVIKGFTLLTMLFLSNYMGKRVCFIRR